MVDYIQDNKYLKIGTSLGDNELLLTDFRGTEGISTPFHFNLQLISKNTSIDFQQIIGTNTTISIEQITGEVRFFNGIISSFSQSGDGAFGESRGTRMCSYSARVVPWFWLLTRTADLRIFQNLTVIEIIEQIFTEHQMLDFNSNGVVGEHEKREYCVQYRETDFNFVSRLLEEEGIYYFFKHENGKHTLMLADSPEGHIPCPLRDIAEYGISKISGSVTGSPVIRSLELSQEIRPGKYTLKDYNFEIPNTNLLVEMEGNKGVGPGEREIYDYPGNYSKRGVGDGVAEWRMQEEEARITSITGTSRIDAFTSGYCFTLKEFHRIEMNDKEYALVAVNHAATCNYLSGSASQPDAYENSFTCIPKDAAIPFRPPRITPKPVVEGVQTAIVVGKAGEEIYTDEHARVKVQFHWDREGKRDENSSCWIRVSQLFAGANWGAMFIPRIGQEVIVDFVEGDPDRPIITGRVYHGLNKPPYTLPAEKTKSTIKTNSSKGGDGFNEIRFEDKKGEEQLFFHAEKDQDIRIKNTRKEYIGNERHLTVEKDQFEKNRANKHTIIAGDLLEQVDGNVDHTLAGNRTTTIGGGTDLTVGNDVQSQIGGDKSLAVGGHDKKSVGKALSLNVGTNIYIKAGQKIVLEAGAQISLKVGGTYVDIGPAGVTVKGTTVNLEGSALVAIKGGIVNLNSGGGGSSAAGCSPKPPITPESPDEPKEAILPCNAEAGQVEEVETPEEKLVKAEKIPQVKVFERAAESGTPFCAACEAKRQAAEQAKGNA
jgi:type VI secretion system secreted protein VgrG